MEEVYGTSVKIDIKNGYKRITELKYVGYKNADGTIRLKSLAGKSFTEKCSEKDDAKSNVA